MYRLLVFGMTENAGGVESCIMNYYRHVDKDKIQFDFLCNTHKQVAYEEELKRLGGRCYHITARSENFRKYNYELEKVFSEHSNEWDAIWVNVCSLANIDYLKKAKKYGLKRCIIHSHNSQNMDGKLRILLHYWNRKNIKKLATDFWACSEEAADWFYQGEERENVVVIHNAIDLEKMKFDEKKREDIRKDYDLGNKYVIGNIGRLHFQKNQSFAIDVFTEFHKNNKDSVLILVGQGDDEKFLKEKVKENNLEDAVIFTGIQKDIQAWLSAFDLFLFPSLFEGLSIAALEAQANGVPVLASDKVIPEDVKINDNFVFYDLKNGEAEWCNKVEKMKSVSRTMTDSIKSGFVESGFDIKNEVKNFERLVLNGK